MTLSLAQIRTIIFLAGAVIVGYHVVVYKFSTRTKPIKVGILYSVTGAMRMSEEPVLRATLLAINEINEKGGVLGRQLEPVIADGRSDAFIFQQQAERLITSDHVEVIGGCWLSSCRKAVNAVVEKHGSMLIYPAQYEGMYPGPNTLHTGETFNQEVLPATMWALRNLGKRIFIIGNESLFPRVVDALLQQMVPQLGGEIVGSEYITIGDEKIEPIVEKITQVQPDVIINNIAGSSNIILFEKFRKAREIWKKNIPVMSYNLNDPEIAIIGPENVAGSYTCGSYYDTIKTPESEKFVQLVHKAYGKFQTIAQTMQAAYEGMHIWAQGVERAGSTNVTAVKQAIRNQLYLAPEGIVAVSDDALNLYKPFRVALINPDGSSTIVWDAQMTLPPYAFPSQMFIKQMITTWSPEKWSDFLHALFVGWNNKWHA